MRSDAELFACRFNTYSRQGRIYVLDKEQEKLEKLVEKQLEKGGSLSDDVLLEQSALIDRLVIDEMLLSELKEKL